MKLYPYSTAIILDDTIFLDYGGNTGTSSTLMRSAAYMIAEQQMSDYLDTLLLPTKLSGTVNYFPHMGYFATEYGYVTDLESVSGIGGDGVNLFQLNGVNNYAIIREDTYGYILVDDICRWRGFGITQPMTFNYVYTAGLPTGTATMPGMLLALTKAAQIILNELEPVPANESTGDIGVQEYSSLQYKEIRKKWHKSAFGDSPATAFIARIVDTVVKKARRSVMIGKK